MQRCFEIRHFQKVHSVCQLQDISDVLHRNRCSLSKCAWRWEENGRFDIPVQRQETRTRSCKTGDSDSLPNSGDLNRGDPKSSQH